jgi:hypothetical protein
MKYGKAAGHSDIVAEMKKAGEDNVATAIYTMINSIIREDRIR